MKKFLHKMFAVLVLGLFSVAAMAQDATIVRSNTSDNGVVITDGLGWNSGMGYLCGPEGSVTISAEKAIEKIVLTENSNYRSYGLWEVSTGTFTTEGVVTTWTGNATSVTFTNPGTEMWDYKGIDKFEIWYAAEGEGTGTEPGVDPLQTAYEAWKELLTGKMQAVYDDCGGFYGQAPTEDEVGKKPAAVVAAVYNHVKEYSIVFDSYMGFGDNWSGANDYLVATYGKDIEALYAEALAIWEAYENAALVEAEEEEVTLVKEGVATGAYTDSEGHDVELEEVPVAYAKYSDGSIVLKNFWNTGVDLKVKLDEPYELEGTNYANALIDDVEGFGATAAGTTFFAFVNPVTYNEETSKGLLLGGFSRYVVEDDELDLYYQNAAGAYMCFFVDLASEFVGEDPTGVDTVLAATSNKIYDLAGRRVVKVQKGINIVNGKVVLK